jgi:3-deoxy-D-manno-octulosonic-acid transferase
MSPSGWLLAYRLATGAIEPLAPVLLRARARRGKEDPARLAERLGRAGLARPRGPLVWLHGVSVGESLSLVPLVRALRNARPDIGLLVTSATLTSAALLAQRLPAGVIHQYAPIDGPRAVSRFLDHWRPDLAVFVESELWPNLLIQARRRGVKTALLSAKLSDASARAWSGAPRAARSLLGGFDLLLAQDQRAAERLSGFGVRADGVADLKFGAQPLPVDASSLEAVRAGLAGRRMILAASTHPGEEEILLARFGSALQAPEIAAGAPLLVIVPRHPERGPAVAALAREQGFSTGLQSAGEAVDRRQVYVADVLGELGLWYRLAHLAIIGGSLREGLAGHNPLEPARLHRPFISGRHVSNWTTVYAELERAEATHCLANELELDAHIRAAIEGDDRLAEMAERAWAYVDRRDAEARAVPAQILKLLP